MNSEILGRAAALMRERAEAVPASPWWADGHTMRGGREGRALGSAHNAERPVSEHIASWHPAVALAVAESVELAAVWVEKHPGSWPPWCSSALAVAVAYVGEQP